MGRVASVLKSLVTWVNWSVLSFACVVFIIVKKRRSGGTSRASLLPGVWFLQTERTTALSQPAVWHFNLTLPTETFFHTNVTFFCHNYQLAICVSWSRSKKRLAFCGILLTLQRLEFVIHVRSYDLNGEEFIQFDLERSLWCHKYVLCGLSTSYSVK